MRPSRAAAIPTIRLRSPGEIVSAVPYLVGFIPADSLVVLGLAARQLTLTCRVDLVDVGDERTARSVVDALTRSGASQVLLVSYASSRTESAAALTRMRDRLHGTGIGVMDRIAVSGGRWFDVDCRDTRCCPVDGTPVADHDEAPSTMSFHAFTGGYRQERADIVAECYPDDLEERDAIRSQILMRCRAHIRAEDPSVGTALTEVLGWGSAGRASALEIAVATLASADAAVRDQVYALVNIGQWQAQSSPPRELARRLRAAGAACGDLDEDGMFRDGPAHERMLARMLAWVRNLPDDLPAVTMPALVVVAFAHWCGGDGARARTLVERARALDVEPMPMLTTLTECIARGIRLTEPHARDVDGPGGGRQGRSVA